MVVDGGLRCGSTGEGAVFGRRWPKIVGFNGNSGSPEMGDTKEVAAHVLPEMRRSWCGREKIEVCGRLRCGGCGSERGEMEGGGDSLSPTKWRDREKKVFLLSEFAGSYGERGRRGVKGRRLVSPVMADAVKEREKAGVAMVLLEQTRGEKKRRRDLAAALRR
ncbi:hypothetical protein HAX54_046899 [Datura stramonium]|uniref:Uncharacterized protein n=1 Tax=Datura stramonium TaxID=4076 RepID=A0ABS8WHN8_DATST|nr:hypothetical protein [Datura stramonium]